MLMSGNNRIKLYRSDNEVNVDTADSVVLFDPNKGEFSQWYPATCTLDGITFNCAEQLMMYAKASMLLYVLTITVLMEQFLM